ncbi:hypothetical protein LC1Hm_3295 [Halomicrobium sp. LC1Hm]|nr:hypothetical protein LC1Hm_3295 [Halomicrobium sp. LC1Hm]
MPARGPENPIALCTVDRSPAVSSRNGALCGPREYVWHRVAVADPSDRQAGGVPSGGLHPKRYPFVTGGEQQQRFPSRQGYGRR